MKGFYSTHNVEHALLLETAGPSLFKPRDGHVGIHIHILCNGELGLNDTVLDESEVAEWAQSTPPTQVDTDAGFHVRLLCCAPKPTSDSEQDHSVSLVPIPFSRNTYESVRVKFQIHGSYLSVLYDKTPVWTKFTDEGTEERSRSLSFVIRDSTAGECHSAAAYTYLPDQNLIYGVVQGLQIKEITSLLQRLRLSLYSALQPTLIPWMLLRQRFEITTLRIKILANNVHGFEQTTRMLPETSSEPKSAKGFKKNDYKWRSASRGLTTFSEGLAHVTHSCEIDLRILDFLDEIDMWTKELAEARIQSSTERIALLRSWLHGTRSRISYLEKRTQAQIQTLYSLIAQRDNAVSIHLAEASKATAEASLRDNQTMRQLAEDSRNIAAATQKDSAAMRTIAIVTIVFLPGTFTASLFSADFFNLQPKDGLVSSWVWVYAGLTSFLTIAVFVGYMVPMRRKAQEIDRLADGKEKVT